jgi:hypothetical protein
MSPSIHYNYLITNYHNNKNKMTNKKTELTSKMKKQIQKKILLNSTKPNKEKNDLCIIL